MVSGSQILFYFERKGQIQSLIFNLVSVFTFFTKIRTLCQSGVTERRTVPTATTNLPTVRPEFARPDSSSARTTTAPWPPPSATASTTAATLLVRKESASNYITCSFRQSYGGSCARTAVESSRGRGFESCPMVDFISNFRPMTMFNY